MQLVSSLSLAWRWVVYDWLTIGEMKAIHTGRPLIIRAGHHFNLAFTGFMFVRTICAIAALKSPSIWAVYSRLDRLFYLVVKEKQLDIFGCVMGLFLLAYIAFDYSMLYFDSSPQAFWKVLPYDFLVNVFQHGQRSRYFPEFSVNQIQSDIEKIMRTMKYVYFGLFVFIEIILGGFVVQYTLHYGRFIFLEHPIIVLDAALLFYYAHSILHFHIFIASLVLFTATTTGALQHDQIIIGTVKKTAHGNLEATSLTDLRRGHTWLTARLLITRRLLCNLRNFSYVARSNQLISRIAFSYVLINLFNPSFIICYLLLKRQHFRIRLLYNLLAFFSLQIATIPLLYYTFSMINIGLQGSAKKFVHLIQHHFRGPANCRFKIFVLVYYETLTAKRRPGLTIGPSNVVSKMKALRISITYVVYFLMIWTNYYSYFKHISQ